MPKKIKGFIFLTILMLTHITIEAAPEKNQVMQLLEGRHWELREEKFLQLGEGTDQVLREISNDEEKINYLRFRALEALTVFNNEETAIHLEGLTKAIDPNLARRGFRALSRGFSRSQPLRVRKVAERLMQNPSAYLRIEAAKAMRSLDKPSYQKFLRTESKDWVRSAVSQ